MNDLYCSAAIAKQDVQVPAGRHFVCPHCAKPLVVPPTARRGMPGRLVMIGSGLAVAVGAMFAVGALVGKGAPQPLPASVRASPAAPDSPEAPRAPAPALQASASSLNPGVAGPAAQSAAGHGIAAQQTIHRESMVPRPEAPRPGMQLAMVQTQANALAPRPAPPPPSNPPAQKTQDVAQMRATAQAAAQAQTARQTRAAELARRAQAAQVALQQQKAAALQAQDLQRRADAQKAQDEADALARQQQEAARAAQAAAAAKLAEAKRLAATPPALHGPTRGFSAVAVAGGAPAYPQAYDGESRTGRVTVSCLIRQDGTPSGCHVVAAQGGVGFNNAALGWLRSGNVRFAPVLRNGQPQAEEHSWTMKFQP